MIYDDFNSLPYKGLKTQLSLHMCKTFYNCKEKPSPFLIEHIFIANHENQTHTHMHFCQYVKTFVMTSHIRQKVRHDVKVTSWGPKSSVWFQNMLWCESLSWHQKYVMTSKESHDVKPCVMTSKSVLWSKRYVMTSKRLLFCLCLNCNVICVIWWANKTGLK